MVSKKVVVVLVIIALVLAVFSVVMSVSNSSENVSTSTGNQILEDDDRGQVSLNINPAIVEDKNG